MDARTCYTRNLKLNTHRATHLPTQVPFSTHVVAPRLYLPKPVGLKIRFGQVRCSLRSGGSEKKKRSFFFFSLLFMKCIIQGGKYTYKRLLHAVHTLPRSLHKRFRKAAFSNFSCYQVGFANATAADVTIHVSGNLMSDRETENEKWKSFSIPG